MSALLAHQQIISRGDPLWSKVVALLHFDGSNGSTSFPDSTGRTWTPSNVAVDNSIPLNSGGAGFFGGPSNPSGLATSKTGLAMSGDFCIEATTRLSAMPSSGRIMAILSTGNLSAPYYGLRWFFDESGRVGLFLSSNGSITTDIYSTTAVIAANTTYQVCVERQGTTVRLYIGGLVVATGTFAGTIWLSTGTANAYIGAAVDRSGTTSEQGRFGGRVDEFRWTIGAARYGGAYSPSTLPFPDGP